MIRYHEATDASKVAELAASMDTDGWRGSPLVAIGDELLTGAHRHTAYVQVFGSDYGIPVIELADLFAEAGLDLDTVMADEGCTDLSDATMVYVLNTLPGDIRETYGIDVH